MTAPKQRPDAGRIIAISALLRQGHSASAVARMLRVTDKGGSHEEALAALRGEPVARVDSGGTE